VNNNIFVTDTNKISKFDTANNILTIIGGTSTSAFAGGFNTNAKFSNPKGLIIDSNGTIYVADTNNHRIRKMLVN
jgi:hypothetical protein